MKISAWPASERPREKLQRHGPDKLSDAELLAIIFRTGSQGVSAVELSKQLLNTFGNIRNVLNADINNLMEHKGVGHAKYVQLQACLELSKRYFSEPLTARRVMASSVDVRRYVMHHLRDKEHEVFAVLWLDVKHRLIEFDLVFEGTINATAVYPRTLIKRAMKYNAGGAILVHNHPSGDPNPSRADKQITATMEEAFSAIDVQVIDHIIVGDGQTYSFAEQGLLKA